MIQRSSTLVARSDTLAELGAKPLYSESAVRADIMTELADLSSASMPMSWRTSAVLRSSRQCRKRMPTSMRALGSSRRVKYGYRPGEHQLVAALCEHLTPTGVRQQLFQFGLTWFRRHSCAHRYPQFCERQPRAGVNRADRFLKFRGDLLMGIPLEEGELDDDALRI